MTPELEPFVAAELWDKYSELFEVIQCDMRDERSLITQPQFHKALKDFAASQLSAERTWWITRIEQERWTHWRESGEWKALDDLLTSVRERGGK